jgi:PPOX class probable F420-dependent enzyme
MAMGAPDQLLAAVRDYLLEPRCAVLSTIDPHGAPHQTVVHYLLEADALIVNGRPDRRWAAHLRRDPRVSIVIHDVDRPLHWVGIKGSVRQVGEGAAAVEDAMAMARRYGEDPAEYRDLERVSFRITPRRVFEYG